VPEPHDPYTEYVTARLPTLRRVALALVGNAHRADDLVQEAIVKLYVHWRRASRARDLDAYCRQILVRTFLDERRSRWASVQLRHESPEHRPATGTGDPADAVTVRAALAQLPPKQRAVLVLRFLADLSVDDVADLVGCSAGTVKSQTFHGLAAMRRTLGEPGPEPEPGPGGPVIAAPTPTWKVP
jgi:RNA polymerase sigma-70 factor (sigma-E family)